MIHCKCLCTRVVTVDDDVIETRSFDLDKDNIRHMEKERAAYSQNEKYLSNVVIPD
jgi:hypothetical protein